LQHKRPKISIVGAGAAGCFCAAQLHEALPGADIRILEAGPKPLAKLALTGGGRCNITNTFESVRSLDEVYPRGANLMKRALADFSWRDTLDWFERRGVRFVTEDGGRVFPASQDAGEIVRVLLKALEGVSIECGNRITALPEADSVVVTTGGAAGMEILGNLPVDLVPPVPSLFSFNISDTPQGGRSEITALMGMSQDVTLCIPSTKLRSEGALLITDWGFSGPAALRLSSYGARYLAEHGYASPVSVRWIAGSETETASALAGLKAANTKKLVRSVHPEGVQARLWEHIIARSGLRADISWGELGSKGLNHLVQTLLCDTYYIHGKTRFRDEFVTCGGVSLSSINAKTLECKRHPGLYFAGEVLDVDAVTGGFNLQAAWSTAHLAAKSIISSYDTQNL
jgi:predicted Rossmann fold flavoprotein